MSSTNQTKANIGLIGLGVMGQNLSLNIERNGYSVAVYDRDPPVLEKFASAHTGKKIVGCSTPEQFVHALERPRKIILLVKAGDPVDWTVNLVKPYLEPGDIIIDGGNSHFADTERREKALKIDSVFFIGSGTSGGEKGALWGPSLMPGGEQSAYEQIRPLCKDGPQRHRVWRHAVDRRDLRNNARRIWTQPRADG
jgi:6-phosphogluconate dehydrogenase